MIDRRVISMAKKDKKAASNESIKVPKEGIIERDGKYYIEKIKKPEEIRTTGFEIQLPDDFKVVVDKFRHTKNENRPKARVRLYDSEGALVESDAFPMDSHKKRKEFINRSKKHGIDVPDEALIQAGEEGESELDAEVDYIENPPTFTHSDEELDKAQKILRDKPLKFILDLDIGIFKEPLNVLILFLVCVSRLLLRPVSLLCKGSSGSGKTVLVSSVVRRLMPEGHYKEVTRMTAKVLERLKPHVWDNKVIILSEIHGFAESDYQFRVLMSEGVLTLLYPVKVPDTEEWTYKEHTTEQKCAFISTTIRDRISDENETRTMTVYVDDSPEHMADIKDYMARIRRKVDDEPIRVAKTMQICLLEEADKEVIIPYLQLVAQDVPGDLRDFDRFRTLLEACTLVHAKQRPRVIIDDQEFIVSTLSDYHIIQMIFHEEAFIPVAARKILAAIPHFEEFFTRKDIQKALHWGETKVRELVRFLEGETIEVIEGGPGIEYVYRRNVERMPTVKELAIGLEPYFKGTDDETLTTLLRELGGVRVCIQKMKKNCYNPFTGDIVNFDELDAEEDA